MWVNLYRTIFRGRNSWAEAKSAQIYPSQLTMTDEADKCTVNLCLYSKKIGKNPPVVIEASCSEAALLAISILHSSGYSDCKQFPELREPLKELHQFLLKKVEQEK